MTESGLPTPGATIPVRVQRHVLALLAVIAALGLLLIGALVLPEQRQAFGVRVLGAVAVLAIALGAVVLWRMLRLIRLDAERQLRLHAELDDYVHMLDQAQRVGRVGLWRADYDHDRLDASPETWDILGLPPELHTMQGLRMSIHPEDRPAYAAAVERARTLGERTEIRYRIVNPEGRTHWFQASAAPQCTDSEGRVVRMSGTVQDITERALAEQEVARYRNELERMVEERTADLRAVNAELEAFCYSVSHDLRGPLRGIDGFSQALLEEYGERLDAPGRDYLQRVRAGVQRMGRLIDDLLNLSRVSRVELQRQEVNLGAMAEEVLRALRADEDAHALEWEVQPGMQVWGDAGLLHVLLENLLGNAWKFTARVSHPRIQFGASQQAGETAYHVRDNGAGFDMRFADKLFGAFQRLHDSREFEGTGIGLATAQRIVHRHGGRIWAEGSPGAGATFYFTLAARTEARA